MNNFFKTVLVLSVTSLAACGGGGSESGNGSTGGGNPNPNPGGNVTYVSGSFKNAIETGDYFNKVDPVNGAIDQYGSLAQDCVAQNEYYFESANVQVYGVQGLPETDFKQVATWIEDGLEATLAKMNISVSDLMEKRRSLAIWAYTDGAFAVSEQLVSGVQYPSDYESWDYDDKVQFGKTYLANASYDERIQIVQDYYASLGYSMTEQEISYGKKVRVCLHQSDNSFRYGEGVFNGMNVAAPSVNTVNNNTQVINHELVHMVQEGIAHTTNTNPMSRWFLEGQAVVISGQEVASHTSHNDYDTPKFVSYYDENGYDQAEIYKHYGLAYKYIQDANGIDAIMNMIADLRNYDQLYTQLPSGYEFNGEDSAAFVLVWDNAGLVDKNNDALSLQRWISEYHQLMDLTQ